jgi:ornithine cyclodeaminase
MTMLLAAGDIREIVRRVGLDALMDEIIGRLAEALRDYDPEATRVAVRDGFTYAHPHVGLLETMPFMEVGGRATIKMVGYHPENPMEHALPTILGTVLTFDVTTGHVTGLLDGTFLTAVRTAAASAVASTVLAPPDSGELGLIGCGAQAVAHVHALCRVFPVVRVRVHDRDPRVVAGFASRVARFVDIPIVTTTPAEIVATSDILCTATSVGVGEGPVFEDGETRPHLHVNAVGADFPGKTELPRTLLDRSVVCPDFPDQTAREGECQQLDPGAVGPNLVELLQAPESFRHLQGRTTVFDSTGFALEDHVAAGILLAHARALGLGSEIDFEATAHDPYDPYGFLGDQPARP